MKNALLIAAAVSLMLGSCGKDAVLDPSSDQASKGKKSERGNLTARVVADNLSFPWEILWGPDGKIWFTEREGRVKKLDPATGAVSLVATIPDVVSTSNFNGLLGMALHPNFSTDPYVFLVYNYRDGGAYLEKVVRFRYEGSTLGDATVLVDSIIGKEIGGFIHNGSRLAIGPDMKLYITTGDADRRFTLPQNPDSLNGKTLRINLDGSIPADNPYGNEVWTIGHRNAQGLVFAMGRLYSSEHGEDTDDEINIIEKGRNYGWPYVEGFCDMPAELSFCSTKNVMQPIYAWTPTVAPCGIDFYNSNEIAQWKQSLLVTFLKDKRLRQMKLNATGTAVEGVHDYFVNQFGRLRDIAISPSGKVYICTDNGDNMDKIIEISKGN